MTNQPAAPLTELQLDEIEGRAAALYEYATVTDYEGQAELEQLTDKDVPALVAEVRRLRAELAVEKAQHATTLRQRNNRSERLLYLRDVAKSGQTGLLVEEALNTLAASVNDHVPVDGDEMAASLRRDGFGVDEIADILSRPTAPAAEEQSASCGKCKTPFDPADTRHDGHAREGITSFCRRCVDRCHENSDAFHVCAVCREGGE